MTITILGDAELPTRAGLFRMLAFAHPAIAGEQVALVRGDPAGARALLVRVHSECLTSEVFGSLRCDCREQLALAQAKIASASLGAVIYLRQEGRGIGLGNKLRAYELQGRGHDTVDANRLLNLPDDAREYSAAAALLEHLGVESIRLITNNPDKARALSALGVKIDERVPSIVSPTPYSASYLTAKRDRMGHTLPRP